MRIIARRLMAASIALAVSFPLAAQEPEALTLDEALGLSLQRQPALTAYDRTAQAFRESAVAARQLPDFRLTAGLRNFPVLGEGAFEFDSAMMTMKTIGIGREQVRQSRREAASARLLAEAEVSLAEQQLLARRIQREVLLGWTEAKEAQLRQQVLRELIARLEGRLEAVEAAIPTGRAISADAVAVRAEIAAARAALEQAEAAEAAGRASLMRWVGDAAEQPLDGGLAICRPPDPQRVQAFLDDHPAIEAAQRQTAVAERAIDFAQAERKPNWGWSVMYGQRDSFSDVVSLEVSIDLPLNRDSLQNRRIAEASARAAAARDRAEDVRRELQSQYRRALAQWNGAMDALSVTESQTLPALRAAESALEARFEGTGGDLSAVLAARERTTRTALELVDQQGAVARTSADLLYYIEECAE